MRILVIEQLCTVFLFCALVLLDKEGLFPLPCSFSSTKPTGGKWHTIRISSASYSSPVTTTVFQYLVFKHFKVLIACLK